MCRSDLSAIQYQVTHITKYRYSEGVSLCQNQIHLSPRSFASQRCPSTQLTITPTPANVAGWWDYFGNRVTYFAIETEHDELVIAARSRVEVLAREYPAPEATPAWELVRERLAAGADDDCRAAVQFTCDSRYVRRLPEAWDYAASSFLPGRPLLAAVLDLTGRIHRDFRYDPTATCVQTPTSEVLRQRRGVCQDFAHLQLACLRAWGLPARYVSGYLLTDPPPGQPKLVGADASHAWLAVFCPGYGWWDLDPTNNQMPSRRHVTLAWGRDYHDVCPINGVFSGGGQHGMSVSVDVSPLAPGSQHTEP